MWVLFPQSILGLELFGERGLSIGLHRDVAFLPELADHVHGAILPVDVAVWIDAADLVEPRAGSEGEANETLEARMQRVQQLLFLVEAQDTRSRFVLAALDATERILEVVALFDRPFEDRLEQTALTPDRTLRDPPARLVSRRRRHLSSPEVQVPDDVRLGDLVERPRAEVREEMGDDVLVAVPRGLQRRVRLLVDRPPFREARNRALPAVNPRADVVFDVGGAAFGRFPIRESGRHHE